MAPQRLQHADQQHLLRALEQAVRRVLRQIHPCCACASSALLSHLPLHLAVQLAPQKLYLPRFP